MDERSKKKSPAQVLGEETGAAFTEPGDMGEDRICSDVLGSYTGAPKLPPRLIMDVLKFYVPHIDSTQVAEQGVQFVKPSIDTAPTQDADDL